MASLSTILETARDILRDKKKAMHVNEIAEEAVNSARNQGMTAEVFSKKLLGALAGHLKLKTQKPVFMRVEGKKKGTMKKGYYRLKREVQKTIAARVEVPEAEKAFVGKGGEYAVMSELLFWGFNVSLMSVDHGIDVIAQKENNFYNIQVKTSVEQDGRKFSFSIKRSSFAAYDNSSTFYVFVMRKKMDCFFAIFPSSKIHELKEAGKIAGKSSLSISITADEKWNSYRLNGVDVTMNINDFSLVR